MIHGTAIDRRVPRIFLTVQAKFIPQCAIATTELKANNSSTVRKHYNKNNMWHEYFVITYYFINHVVNLTGTFCSIATQKIVDASLSNPLAQSEEHSCCSKRSLLLARSQAHHQTNCDGDDGDVYTTRLRGKISFAKANSSNCVSTDSSCRGSGRQRRPRPECNIQCVLRTLHSGDFDNRIFSGFSRLLLV